MLANSDTSIKDVLKRFSVYGIETAFLVPTETGLKKSILDAIAPLRSFLKAAGIHDYDLQGQGTDNKVCIDCYFASGGAFRKTKASLYRPETKDGDPRIWFYGLKEYAVPNNLLALFIYEGQLYVVNASDNSILESINDQRTPLGKIALTLSGKISGVASELLGKLKDIHRMGFVPSLVDGDTGIGMTLENLLGIPINVKKTPDYKGIELKASRHARTRKRAKNRVTLFSQTPDWKRSPISNAYNLLDQHGYLRDGRLQLYCTIDAKKPNSQSLQLAVDEQEQLLKTIVNKMPKDTDLMYWGLERLRGRLSEKHPETFWVKAESKNISGNEHFLYHKVVHTNRPLLANLDYGLSTGVVSLDLTLSLRDNGKVRDHGYLFKMWPEDFETIFPPPKEYDLR